MSTIDIRPQFIGDQIQKDINDNHRQKTDSVVLFRANWLMNPIKTSLSSRGIPFVHIGDRETLTSPVTRLLKASIAIAGGRPEAIIRLKKPLSDLATITGIELPEPEQVIGLVDNLNKLPPSKFVDAFLNETGLFPVLQNSDLNGYLDIAIKVIQAAIQSGSSGYQELGRTLVLEWNRLESQVLRAEDSVKLMSIHQAKGLEFPIVYIIRVEDQRIPYIRSGSTPNIPEERRLLFVAITRAKERVIMSYCRNNDNGWPCAPSRFFDDIAQCDFEEI